MKRLLCVVLSLGFFVATAFCVPFVASAQEYKGTQIKNSTTYYYYDAADKTLYINGNGDIPNLSNRGYYLSWRLCVLRRSGKGICTSDYAKENRHIFSFAYQRNDRVEFAVWNRDYRLERI